MTEIPYGYCHCGCGQKTKIAPQTERKRGFVRGEPHRYLAGHRNRPTGEAAQTWKGGRVEQHGYIKLFLPEHPRANSVGYVLEHIVVAERALGKPLPEGACVHHVNEVKRDNRNRNLVICPDNAYHMLLHRRQRAYRACGHADWIRCMFCAGYGDPSSEDFHTLPSGVAGYHRACERDRRARRRTQLAAERSQMEAVAERMGLDRAHLKLEGGE